MDKLQFLNRSKNNTLKLSFSSCKNLLETSTPLQFLRYCTRDRSKDKSTPSLVFGKLVHNLLLEPHNFNRGFLIQDILPKALVKRLKPLQGKLKVDIVKADKVIAAMQLCKDIRANKHARDLLQDTDKEKLVEGEILAVPFRGYVDIINTYYIADLKTTQSVDPKKFMYSMLKYNYHLQAAIYRELTGVKDYYIIAVEVNTGLTRVFNIGKYIHLGADLLSGIIKRYKHLQRLSQLFGPKVWEDNTLPSIKY